ncbi:AMP-binding protein [Mycobacterium sp. 236(2023)]|uniref:AMP-binding protein n=1 Tax=Mycobacterium sp. 236(2023) TaxID=3038163 RepID=UPI0024154272|nr:AMP-binding protein [Mycobacterium sp. 236(2023)]MDG4667905.1 AMP-binding protein [Mycobacterium sp. 236(2023)]
MSEWTIAAIFDAVVDKVPDRTMTICGDRRRTFAEVHDRTVRLANFLTASGLGARYERDSLQDWECGQDRVALIMHNDLYPDAVIGCLRARTIPVNVNHYYTPREVGELLAYIKPTAVIFHRSLGARFAAVLEELAVPVMLSIDDDSDAVQPFGAIDFDTALADSDAGNALMSSPDDLLMMCTGGTTGRPKGVLWRQGDMYVSSMSGDDHESIDDVYARVATVAAPWFALSPLMHAAGMWTAFNAILVGIPVVVHDSRQPFDARGALEIAEREKVSMMTMVGDAYAAPLIEELNRHTYDLSSLAAIGIGGAATNVKHQQALLNHLPHITLANGYGSSETGNMGFGHSQIGDRKDTFALRAGTVVVSDDYARFLKAGDTEIGWVARSGRIPLGYFDDQAATQSAFRRVEDIRVVIAGDRAQVESDGTLRLHGRDSLVINTGGEKVFVEEVEEALRAHPAVTDALVVGRPSERWGQEIAALVSLREVVSPVALREHCAESLARFKIPKEIIVVDAVRRLGNGKADYRWARTAAALTVPTPTEATAG